MLRQIFILACFSVIIPLGVGLRNFRSYNNDRKALTFFLLLSALIEIASYSLWKKSINNLPLLHLYTIIEFVFISYIYSLHLTGILSKKAVWSVAIAFIGFSLYNSFFIQSLQQFNSYARGIEFILIIFYSVVFVYVLSTRKQLTEIRAIPMFWLNTGILLYYSMSFFLFLLSNNMLAYLPKATNQFTWAIHGIVLLVYYTFLVIALWIPRRR